MARLSREQYLARFGVDPETGQPPAPTPIAYLPREGKVPRLSEVRPEPEPLRTGGISAPAAAGIGFGQGLTLGFGEEMRAGVAALGEKGAHALLGERYRRQLGIEREQMERARTEQGASFAGGELLGLGASAVIPGAGPLRAARPLATVARGAGYGGLAGLGASEADLTRGEFAAAAKDVGRGTLAGGAAAGILRGAGAGGRKALAWGERRMGERPVEEMLEKVPAITGQDKALAQLGGRPGLKAALAAEGLTKQTRDPLALAAELGQRREARGQAIGDYFEKIDQAAPGPKGVSLPDIFRALATVKAERAKKLGAKAVRAIEAQEEEIRDLALGRGLDKHGISHVPAADVHAKVREYFAAGFGGKFDDPTAERQLARDIGASLREALQKHAKGVAARNPSIKKAGDIEALNAEFSRVAALEDLAVLRAKRAERNAPTLAERGQTMLRRAADITGVVGGLGAIATGRPELGLAALAPAMARGLPWAERAAEAGLASLSRFARAGGRPADVMRMATALGISRDLAMEAVRAARPRAPLMATGTEPAE